LLALGTAIQIDGLLYGKEINLSNKVFRRPGKNECFLSFIIYSNAVWFFRVWCDIEYGSRQLTGDLNDSRVFDHHD
jgi:hypothetical protein